MNIRELILPLILALVTWWGVRYFFFSNTATDAYRFTAPQSAVECKPLNKEINFIETKRSASPMLTPLETKWANLEFSTDGAALTRLEFKRKMNGRVQKLGTIFPPDMQDKLNRAFVIGLHGETPFVYHLADRHENDEHIALTYHADASSGKIKKTFTVYKEKNQIDVTIDLDPRDKMSARLFYPAPIMPALKKNDVVSADIVDGSDTFSKIGIASVKGDEGWVKPELFGVEDKYFVHALVKDPESFAQRAYFKKADNTLTAIVEGPAVTEQTNWTLSFYMGPKEESIMQEVDPRLEQTLDYSGIWAPISRVLLTILMWLYDYFHNYGIAIIVLTFLIRLLLTPFALSTEKGAKGRLETQKRMQYINQKYKDDPQAKMAAQAELMRKDGFGLGSCFPMLLQLPIFFGLSRVLSSSIVLYKAPFLWIPDLSASDPYYILPALFVVGMMITALTTPGDAKQKLPMIAMGLMFGAFSANFASGLVLYIVVSVLLQTMQNKLFRLFKLVG